MMVDVSRPRARNRRGGFTAVELLVVCALTALLAVLLDAIWVGLCWPSIEAAARCRVAREANFAAASLARDLGGVLTDSFNTAGDGRLGAPDGAQMVGRDASNGKLTLTFHTNNSTQHSPVSCLDDTLVEYFHETDLNGNFTGRLLRTTSRTGGVVRDSSVVVAKGLRVPDESSPVDGFQLATDGGGVTITLIFAFPEGRQKYVVYVLKVPN
jgi:hypothetical protein